MKKHIIGNMNFEKETENNRNYRVSPFETELFPIPKQIGLFVVGWAVFQLIASFFQFVCYLAFNEGGNLGLVEVLSKLNVSMIVNGGTYATLLVVLLLICMNDVKKLLPSFKHYQSYIAGIACVGAILVFNMLYTNFVDLFQTKITNNANQASLETIFDRYKVLSLLVFGLIGPICEELTYRVGLFSLSSRVSRFFGYFVTAIVFSLIHFNYDAATLTNELLNLPYYIFAAVAFSFTYEHYGFAGSVSAHVINNFMSLLLIRIIC